jgi:hypothetical protein
MRIKNLSLVICFCLISAVASGQVYLNFTTGVQKVTFTDEQWPGSNPRHQGYSFGFDVIVPDGNYFFMPGMFFQKVSVLPVEFDFFNPYKEFSDFKFIKLPLRIGSYVFKNRFADLRLQGGIAGNFLLGVDKSSARLDEDFNGLFAGLMAGASVRVLFLTLGLDYEHGITKIFNPKSVSGVDDKSKLNAFSLSLGVQF